METESPTANPTLEVRIDEHVDKIAKMLGLCTTIGYFLGFVLVNALCYRIWGFTDFAISIPQCIVGAMVFVLLGGLAFFIDCVWFRLLRRLKEKLENIKARFAARWPKLNRQFTRYAPIIVIGLAVFIYIAPLLFARLIPNWLANHAVKVGDHNLLILRTMAFAIATIALYLPVSAWMERKTITKRSSAQFSVMAGATLVTVVFLALCFASLPAALGGLNPDRQDFWIARSALPALATCNRDADLALNHVVAEPVGQRLDVFEVRDLYLLHETPDRVILWSSQCPQDHFEVLKNEIKVIR